jgi:hypothetical protein
VVGSLSACSPNKFSICCLYGRVEPASEPSTSARPRLPLAVPPAHADALCGVRTRLQTEPGELPEAPTEALKAVQRRGLRLCLVRVRDQATLKSEFRTSTRKTGAEFMPQGVAHRS